MSLELYAITIKNLSSHLRQQAESMTKNRRVNSKKCVAGGVGWQVERGTSLPRVSSWKSWPGEKLFFSGSSSHVLYRTNIRSLLSKVTHEQARRAVLQEEGIIQPMEGSCTALTPSLSYKTGAPGLSRMLSTAPGVKESQGGTLWA